jgi:hypothetical protein
MFNKINSISLDNFSGDLGDNNRLYYNARLVCRDINLSNRLIMLHLSTYDGEGVKYLQ